MGFLEIGEMCKMWKTMGKCQQLCGNLRILSKNQAFLALNYRFVNIEMWDSLQIVSFLV